MKKAILLILLLTFTLSFIYAQELTILTEEFPPFNFVNENGEVDGLSTEIVKAMMKETGIDYEIKVFPWKRSYTLTQQNPNTILYSTSRRPSREDLFKWVGILSPSKYSVFALKSRDNIKVNSLEDMKKYKIGTSQGDARETYLKEKGLEHSFESVAGENANTLNFKKLMGKRIDLWPMPDAVAYYLVKNEFNKDPKKVLKRVFVLRVGYREAPVTR